MSHTTDATHREWRVKTECVLIEKRAGAKSKGDILECSQLTGGREALIQSMKEMGSEVLTHNQK